MSGGQRNPIGARTSFPHMKPLRFVLIGAGAVFALVLVALAVVSRSSFQTWAVRRALASMPAVRATVGSVSAGLNHVVVRDIRVVQNDITLVVPAVEADLPLLSAVTGGKVAVSRLVAKGWRLDWSATQVGVSPVPSSSHATTAARVFAGIFSLLELPLEVALDGVQLAGDVTLPDSRGTAKVTVAGGGIGTNREGKFDLTADVALADRDVRAVNLRGTISAAMDTPRTFTRVTGRLDAFALGEKFPQGVKLTADVQAARDARGESYKVAVVSDTRELLAVHASYPADARQLAGTWKLDLRDSDLAPFTLGSALPVFTLAGEGAFTTDPTFATVRASGKLNATADRLAVIQPQLSSIGPVTIVADFDLAQHGGALVVDRLDATIAGTQPVATVRALQAFTFDFKTRRLEVADPARELLGVNLQGIPLAWVQPFFPAVAFSGGDLQGELVATARSGGMALQGKTPLTVNGFSAMQEGRPLLQGVDFSLQASADYAPQGWQAEVSDFTVKRGPAMLLAGAAKVGMLVGANEALKATGKFSADLPGWLAQPAVAAANVLTKGTAAVEFAASFGTRREVQARVVLNELTADPKITTEALPVISADLRADFAPDGHIALNAPLLIERAGRRSDLLLGGILLQTKTALTVDAQVTSSNFVVDDAMILVAAVPASRNPTATSSGARRDVAPPWAGINGSVVLALKKVIYSDSFQASNVSGTLRIAGGSAKIEGLRAGLGANGDAKIDGAVTFDATASQPYAMAADLMVTDFDPAPLFRALNPDQPATVEGRFNLTSKLAGRAAALVDLPAGAGGDFQLTSTGGVFRGLPVSMASKLEATGTLAAGIARLGSLANALSGRNGNALEAVASKAQAVSELVNSWKAISYDQLSFAITRDTSLNAELKDFTLISPEIRLSGRGLATHQPGAPLLDDVIAMAFTLRARGRNAELLKYLGVLDAQTDDLGYAACTVPLKIGGTLGRPDTSELNNRLANLALEKGGVTDKAADLLNRLIGGAK